jgi:hypothetical protein
VWDVTALVNQVWAGSTDLKSWRWFDEKSAVVVRSPTNKLNMGEGKVNKVQMNISWCNDNLIQLGYPPKEHSPHVRRI